MKTLNDIAEKSAELNGEESFPLPESLLQAERALNQLADVFSPADAIAEQLSRGFIAKWKSRPTADAEWPDVVSRYRILVEQTAGNRRHANWLWRRAHR